MREVHIKIYIIIIRDPYSFFIRPFFNLLAWTKVHVQFFELSWILTDSKQSEEQAPALQMSNYTCLIVYQCISQFQLHPGPPSPQHHLHLPSLSVPGVGHLQILCCPGARHLPTLGLFPSFWWAKRELTDAEFYSFVYVTIISSRFILF